MNAKSCVGKIALLLLLTSNSISYSQQDREDSYESELNALLAPFFIASESWFRELTFKANFRFRQFATEDLSVDHIDLDLFKFDLAEAKIAEFATGIIVKSPDGYRLDFRIIGPEPFNKVTGNSSWSSSHKGYFRDIGFEVFSSKPEDSSLGSKPPVKHKLALYPFEGNHQRFMSPHRFPVEFCAGIGGGVRNFLKPIFEVEGFEVLPSDSDKVSLSINLKVRGAPDASRSKVKLLLRYRTDSRYPIIESISQMEGSAGKSVFSSIVEASDFVEVNKGILLPKKIVTVFGPVMEVKSNQERFICRCIELTEISDKVDRSDFVVSFEAPVEVFGLGDKRLMSSIDLNQISLASIQEPTTRSESDRLFGTEEVGPLPQETVEEASFGNENQSVPIDDSTKSSKFGIVSFVGPLVFALFATVFVVCAIRFLSR